MLQPEAVLEIAEKERMVGAKLVGVAVRPARWSGPGSRVAAGATATVVPGVGELIAGGASGDAIVGVEELVAPGSVVTTTLSISGAIWDRRSDMAEGMLSRCNQSRNTSTRKTTICHSHLHPQPAGLGSWLGGPAICAAHSGSDRR